LSFGASTDVALVGDVNGDGISDLVLFRNGTWYVSTHLFGYWLGKTVVVVWRRI